MKGTILEFIAQAVENPELAADLAAVAAKHGFEFTTDELEKSELDQVTGGVDESPPPTFQNFDQKWNQLFNMVTTVLKNQKDMAAGVTRNML